MPEYIAREAIKKAIKDYGKGALSDGMKTLDPVDDIIAIAALPDFIPAADVRPVVKGEWRPANDRERSWQFRCSECGHVAYCVQPTRDRDWKKKCYYNYCPNCGADMRGEKHD